MTEAELLFSELLNCDRTALYQARNFPLNKNKLSAASSVLKRRISSIPIQYILGKTEFMGLEFKLTPEVLIPRPETEIVVETAIKYLSALREERPALNILELGSGSGCIAVSLAKFLVDVEIDAVDISGKALKVARFNAQHNGVAQRIRFIKSDLFLSCALKEKDYDLIISNPPYVASGEIDNLAPEIKYEPRIALDGGREGLDFYRRIISQAPDYLKEAGILIMELGFNQAASIKNIFKNSGYFKIMGFVKDYNNIDRVVVAKRIGAHG